MSGDIPNNWWLMINYSWLYYPWYIDHCYTMWRPPKRKAKPIMRVTNSLRFRWSSTSPSQMLHVWNIYLHLPQKWPSYVGKYSIHGASGPWPNPSISRIGEDPSGRCVSDGPIEFSSPVYHVYKAGLLGMTVMNEVVIHMGFHLQLSWRFFMAFFRDKQRTSLILWDSKSKNGDFTRWLAIPNNEEFWFSQ